jgi:kinesin family protein 3/17
MAPTPRDSLSSLTKDQSVSNLSSSCLSKLDKFNTTCEDNIHVMIRVRPPLQREMEENLPFRSIVMINNENKTCSLVEYIGAEISERERQREWLDSPHLFQLHRFSFDYVYDIDSDQESVYERTAKSAVHSMLEGYNSTIFAYGQTGTGKTFTMEGFTFDSKDDLRGIIPRSIDDIFNSFPGIAPEFSALVNTIQNSWSGLVICKYTMSISLIY